MSDHGVVKVTRAHSIYKGNVGGKGGDLIDREGGLIELNFLRKYQSQIFKLLTAFISVRPKKTKLSSPPVTNH